ncbi:MAG: MbtH family NRPS accessory protein [Cyanobacteria bacterium P01_G01_bin.39]
MYQNDKENNRKYKVVVNQEKQYSIWLKEQMIPAGWKDTGKSGLKQECLDYIKEVWTDMRPLSLRQKMTKSAR